MPLTLPPFQCPVPPPNTISVCCHSVRAKTDVPHGISNWGSALSILFLSRCVCRWAETDNWTGHCTGNMDRLNRVGRVGQLYSTIKTNINKIDCIRTSPKNIHTCRYGGVTQLAQLAQPTPIHLPRSPPHACPTQRCRRCRSLEWVSKTLKNERPCHQWVTWQSHLVDVAVLVVHSVV